MLNKLKNKQSWQEALSDLVTDPQELFTLLDLDAGWLKAATAAAQQFPLKVPRSFIARCKKGDPDDPLLKQVLPLGAELITTPGYSTDPLQEANANPIPGLLHKYHGRVLVTLTSACAVHCRYCFRRHFPYEDNNPGKTGWEKIFTYIKENATISEVILSGGDPLAVSDKLLASFSAQLSQIAHVKRLRIHTRLPIVLPERITHEFIEWLAHLPLTPVIVVHANHPREMNEDVTHALRRLRNIGLSLLNQTVLLKGVNDNTTTLIALSEALFAAGVLPYYLHVLDKVQGAAHFDLEMDRACELHMELSKYLPGYLVPKLVCEVPGEPSKTLVGKFYDRY